MTFVFLDTVGIVGLVVENDQWNGLAQAAWEKAVDEGRRYLTTPQVLLECGNALSRTTYRESICDLRDELLAHGNLIVPTEAEAKAAWSAYRRSPPGGPSIVDCLSFEVMRRIGATEAFTNDRHFAAAGFTVLF